MNESHRFPLQTTFTSIILVMAVTFTVLLALFLAQADQLQVRLLAPFPTARPFVIGAAATITPTLTLTATPTPQPPTATLRPGVTPPTPTPTSVSVLLVATPCVPPEGWQTYFIKRGDTLSAIALRSMRTVDDILAGNCMDVSTVLIPGMTILVPPDVSTFLVGCGIYPGWEYYLVERGDTLFSLARRHGTTVDRIRFANCMDGYYLQAGRQIALPYLPPTATPTATYTPVPPATSTPTPTATPTFTPEPTATPTFLPTDTPLPTATTTPVPPDTPTPTPTDTATPEATVTSTPTATVTPTSTDTPTATVTVTNTAAPTATDTPSPTPEPATATATPPPLPSATPTATGTP